MQKTKVFITGIISILLVGILALPTAAQSPVTADVDRNRLSTDEVLTLKVTIDSSAGQPSQPALPPMDGFEILGSSSGTQISLINGEMSMQATYSYSLHPKETGQLTISPISVQIGGQLYTTDPILVEVSQGTGQVQPRPNQGIPSMPGFPTRPNMPGLPNLNNLFQGLPGNNLGQSQPLDPADAPTELVGQDFFIEAEVDNPNPYLGEQVLYTFRFYQAASLFDQPEYQSPSFTGFWSEEQGDAQTDYTTEAAERAYRVTELQTVLFPTVIGEVTIEPAELTIPGDFFTRGTVLQTQPISINVRPLPDNAPANFEGAVGQFDIQAQMDTKSTEVNETVTLHVTLSGQGNIKGVADPQWTEGPEWRAFDSEATTNSQFSNGIMSGERHYERLLMPTQPGDLMMPAIEFTYFNTETESYETVSTDPIIINVTGEIGSGLTTDLPDAASKGSTVNTAGTAPLIPEFRPNKPASELGQGSGTPLVKNGGYWFLWMLPLFLIAGSIGLNRYRKQRDDTVAMRRSQSAAKRANQALQKARKRPEGIAHADAGRILTRYLEEKLNTGMTGQTQTNVTEMLTKQGLDPALVEKVQVCLMLSEMGRYAPAGVNTDNGDLLNETEQVISELDKELSRE